MKKLTSENIRVNSIAASVIETEGATDDAGFLICERSKPMSFATRSRSTARAMRSAATAAR